MSTEVYIPAGIIGTAVLCIQYAANQWIEVALLPLDGEAVSCTFDAPVYLPNPELTEMTYRGTIQQNSAEALLFVTTAEDRETDQYDLGANGLKCHSDTKTDLENALLCMVGVKETSTYAYTKAPAFADVDIDSPFRDAGPSTRASPSVPVRPCSLPMQPVTVPKS